MPDYQNMFRQFGQDVSGAILAPLESRLAAMQISQKIRSAQLEEAKYASSLQSEEAKKAAKLKAAETLRKQYGDATADAFLAGESLSGIARLRAAATKSGESKTDQNRYGKEFNYASLMTQQVEGQLRTALQKVADAKQAGDAKASAQAMNSYNVLYEGLGTQLKNSVYSLDKDLRETYAVNLASQAEGMLKNLAPDKIDLLTQTTTGNLSNKGVSKEILDKTENTKNAYGSGIDLSGIPSSADIQKYVIAVTQGTKEMSQETAKYIMSMEDPDILKEIINDKDSTDPEKILATSVLKQITAYDLLDPKLIQQASENLESQRKLKRDQELDGMEALNKRQRGIGQRLNKLTEPELRKASKAAKGGTLPKEVGGGAEAELLIRRLNRMRE